MSDARWPVPPPYLGVVTLRPLGPDLVDVDTVAYLSSPLAVTAHSAGRWPVELTRDANLELLSHHRAEHDAGAAFAHAILDRDGQRELGCVYLRPHDDGLARLTFWLVDDTTGRPGATVVLAELLAWADAWGAAPVVVRLLPEETESLGAVAELGLTEIAMPDQDLPYRWFRVPRPEEDTSRLV